MCVSRQDYLELLHSTESNLSLECSHLRAKYFSLEKGVFDNEKTRIWTLYTKKRLELMDIRSKIYGYLKDASILPS